jgi:hypothetical protein
MKTRILILLALATGCSKLTGEDYHAKMVSHLNTINREELRVKKGHNFFWVMYSYSDPKTSAGVNVVTKAPPESGKLDVEFRLKGTRGQAAVFHFQDNKLVDRKLIQGTADETRVMEGKATEIANAVYLASQ